MPGLFESLGGLIERARGFLSGIFGQAAREEIGFPTISEALEAGGLELEIPELADDLGLQERQIELSDRIMAQPPDQLIPGDRHLETDRLLPHKFVYEVEVTQVMKDGSTRTSPFYVGSDTRLTPDEAQADADRNVEKSPDADTVGYMIGDITAAWYSPRGGRS